MNTHTRITSAYSLLGAVHLGREEMGVCGNSIAGLAFRDLLSLGFESSDQKLQLTYHHRLSLA